MKIHYFFLFLLVIFALLDPDPDPATQINADPDQPCFSLSSSVAVCCAGLFYNPWGLVPSRNTVIVPARQATYRLAELIPWNRFQGSVKFKNLVSGILSVFFHSELFGILEQ
jgi:hypothetical protein